MTAKTALGSLDHCCKIGTAKATVLPEPVREPPMQSRPESVGGIQFAWMRVGVLMAMVEREVRSHGSTPSVAKVVVAFRSVDARIEDGAVSSGDSSLFGGGRPFWVDFLLRILDIPFVAPIVNLGISSLSFSRFESDAAPLCSESVHCFDSSTADTLLLF